MRLQCPDGSAVEFARLGSNRGEADEHMVDDYLVHCEADQITQVVAMDMYHPGPPTQDAVKGYRLLRDVPGRVARGCPPNVHESPDSAAAYAFNDFEVDQPPRLLSRPPPDTEPTIFVSFVVGTDGRVEGESVESLSDDRDAVESVRELLSSLEFAPAIHHESCAVRFRIEGPVPIP